MSRHNGLTSTLKRIRIAKARRNETLFLWTHNHPIHDLVAASTTAARDPAASLRLRKEMLQIAPSTIFRKSPIQLPASFSSWRKFPDFVTFLVENQKLWLLSARRKPIAQLIRMLACGV
jgi:hypothetical protein